MIVSLAEVHLLKPLKETSAIFLATGMINEKSLAPSMLSIIRSELILLLQLYQLKYSMKNETIDFYEIMYIFMLYNFTTI